MKKYLTFIFLLFAAGLSYFLLVSSPFRKEVIYIAAATSIKDERGQDMIRGVRLALEHIEQKKGGSGKKIELKLFDDRNNEQTAIQVASDIVVDDDILMVLGHHYSDTSKVAGEIYKKNGIAAMTASATQDMLTLGNEWYFRTIPSNSFQSAFIAHYIKNMGMDTASIICSDTAYGAELMDKFEQFAQASAIKIQKKWKFDPKSKHFHEEQTQIIAELRSESDPGIIFFAAHHFESTRIITALNYPGSNYLIIGPDSFSVKTFAQSFQVFPQERTLPGFFTNGILAISPFMPIFPNPRISTFLKDYLEKYHEEPSWVAACYYDALLVAAESIDRAEINKSLSVRENRKKVRDALSEFSCQDISVKGITGNIYFDNHRNFNRPFMIGVHQNQTLIPAFHQYRLIDSASFEKIKDVDTTMLINDKPMILTHIVYTGVNINEISYINDEDSVCALDFYLWFSFAEDFDPTELIFINAATPIELNDTIFENKQDGVTTKTYHVKGNFKFDMDLRRFPFDRQVLSVKLRHSDRSHNSLVFIPDQVGKNQSLSSPISPARLTTDTLTWKIKNTVSYQDTIREQSDNGIIDYSQFNSAIIIERKGWGMIIKILFPAIIFSFILYHLYSFPFEAIKIKLLAIFTLLLATLSYNSIIFVEFKSHTFALEYVLYVIYGLIVLSMLVAGLAFNMNRKGYIKRLPLLIRSVKIIHLTSMVCLFIFLMISYYD